MPPQPQSQRQSAMPSVQTVIYDPKFRALDPEVQRGVLARIDPEYKALDDDVQKAVLTRLMSPPKMPLPNIGESLAPPDSGNAFVWAKGAPPTRDEDIQGHSPEQGERLIGAESMLIPSFEASDLAPLAKGAIKGVAKVALRSARGAIKGGALTGGMHIVNSAIHGKFPGIEPTAEAIAVGSVFGAIAEPLLAIPGVRRAIARIPKLKEFMAPSKAEEFDAQMEQKAQDLMRRGKEQEAMDLKQAMAARRATRAAQQEAKAQAEAVESAKFKPSPGVKRSMGPSGTRAYDPQADAGFSAGGRPRAKGLPAPPRPVGEEGAEAAAHGGSGVRPSTSEARITYLIRKPVLTPDEAAELERALGPRWKLMRGQGIMQHQAETLGLVRARRAAQGMPEPH